MQLTAFGARDRGDFMVILCGAPSAATDAQAVGRGPSTPGVCRPPIKVVQYRTACAPAPFRAAHRRGMMSSTLVKEQVAQALNTLSEAELQQVAEYVDTNPAKEER
jgi:hypothetical protein